MSINDKKGINLTSGFKYVGGQPLDVRLVAEDESDLQSLVDNGATYNGMVVWVNSTSKRMVFNGSEFIEDVNPNTIGNINDVLEQINGGGTSSGGSSSGGSSGSGITKINRTATFNYDTEQQFGILTSSEDLTTLNDCDMIKCSFTIESDDVSISFYFIGTQSIVSAGILVHTGFLLSADGIDEKIIATFTSERSGLSSANLAATIPNGTIFTFIGYKF